MVFFATPGMLHGGLSLQTFKEWAGNEKNAVIIPGYCMPGTVGNKILSGEKKIFEYFEMYISSIRLMLKNIGNPKKMKFLHNSEI